MQIVPVIIAMAFSILWLSRVRAGVRRLSHTTFIYYTERQAGGEPGADGLEWGTDKDYNKLSPAPASNASIGNCFYDAHVYNTL